MPNGGGRLVESANAMRPWATGSPVSTIHSVIPTFKSA